MTEATPKGLRRAALATLLLGFVAMAAANRLVRGAALPDAAWTPAAMLAGLRSLPPAGPPDVMGIVEGYDDGTVVVRSPGAMQHIRVHVATVIAVPTGPATLADLRPGTTVAIWGRRPWWGGSLTTRALMVLVR